MNIEDFKDAWKHDTAVQNRPALSRLPINGTSSVVYRIRRNIRNEFIIQVLVYLACLLFFLLRPKTALPVFLVSIITLILILQSVFYLSRFYRFYKAIGRLDLSLRKSIRKIIYDLELNIEIYRAYIYYAIPLFLLALITFLNGDGVAIYFRNLVIPGYPLTITGLLPPFLWLLILQIIIYQLLRLHIRVQYVEYLRELKRILDDLETQE